MRDVVAGRRFGRGWVWLVGVVVASMVGATPAAAQSDTGGDGVSARGSAPGPSRTRAGVLGPAPEVSGAGVGQVMPVERFAGTDRVATAVALGQALWGRSAPRVVVASAANYPDALAASALTGVLDAPLLLTATGALSPAVRDALVGFGTMQVTVVGGAAAVSQDVVSELRDMGLSVERLAGPDRYATAAAIAERVAASPLVGTGVYVVQGAHADPGRGWPDAVAVTAVAAASRTPVLLTTRDELPAASVATLEALAPSAVTVIGGPAAVSDAVVETLEESARVLRVAGGDRYATSAAVVEHAETHGLSADWTMAVTGRNWPDALVAGSAVSRLGGQVLLVDPDRLDDHMPLAGLIGDGRVSAVGMAGGLAAISQAVEDRLNQLVGPPDGATVLHPDQVRTVSGTPLRDMVVLLPETAVTFAVGQVLASAAGDRVPEGMIGRVRSISKTDAEGWVTVELDAVSLDQLVAAATVRARLPFVPGPPSTATGTFTTAEASSEALNCSDGSQAGIQATVSTDLAGDLRVTLDYDSEAGTFRLEPTATLGAKVQLDLNGDATVSCSATLAAFTAEWPTIVLWVGWVPVTVTPTMSAAADFAMQVTGKVGATAVGTGSVTLAPFYDSEDGFGDDTSTALSGNLTPVRVEAANVEASTTLKGRLGFLLWKLAGVNVGPDVGLKYTFDPCRAPSHRVEIPQSITLAMQFNDLLTEVLKKTGATAPSHTWTFDPVRADEFGDPVPALCSGAGTFQPAALEAGEVGQAYRAQLAVKADDGTTPTHPDVTFAVDSGTLPAGIQLAADGVLSGTPTSRGSSAFVVKATLFPGTPDQVTRTHAYTLDVLDAHIQIITDRVTPLFVDEPADFTFEADTDRDTTWLNLADDLPDGLTLTPEGRLTGTPTQAGTTTSTVSTWFTDGDSVGEGHRTYAIEVVERIPACTDAVAERDVLFEDAVVHKMDPVSGTAVGLDPILRLVIYRNERVVNTSLTGVVPLAISDGGEWLLSRNTDGSTYELINLDSTLRHTLPQRSADYQTWWFSDVNSAGTAVGSRHFDDGETRRNEAMIVPLHGSPQTLPMGEGEGVSARHVLGDGRVVGTLEPPDGQGWRMVSWATGSSGPSYLYPGDAADINQHVPGTAPRQLVASSYTISSTDTGSIQGSYLLRADGTRQAAPMTFYDTHVVLDSGVVLGQSGDYAGFTGSDWVSEDVPDLWIRLPDSGALIDTTPALRDGETSPHRSGTTADRGQRLRFGLTDEGIVYASAKSSSGTETSFRCLPPTQ